MLHLWPFTLWLAARWLLWALLYKAAVFKMTDNLDADKSKVTALYPFQSWPLHPSWFPLLFRWWEKQYLTHSMVSATLTSSKALHSLIPMLLYSFPLNSTSSSFTKSLDVIPQCSDLGQTLLGGVWKEFLYRRKRWAALCCSPLLLTTTQTWYLGLQTWGNKHEHGKAKG